MGARFILSLDCEGKWGVADQLGPKVHRQLSDFELRAGYRKVVNLLDDYDIAATFAFVGLFAEPVEGFRRLRPELEALAARLPRFLRPALQDAEQGSREGWHGHWAVDQLGSARTKHEIALHGVTHSLWDSMTAEDARSELDLLGGLDTPVRHSRTFVYPRNRVAHTALLPEFGINGYRLAPPPKSRAASLMTEFDIFTRPESDTLPSHPQAIPAGFFVNWQSRARRIVPIELSAARAARMLNTAAETDGIVHFWLHPENVVTAPRTLVLLRKILALVAEARSAGRCEVLTQVDYCRSLDEVDSAAAE